MRKIYVIFVIFIMALLPVKVYAATDYKEKIENIADEHNFLIDNIENIKISDVIEYASDQIKENLSQPYKISLKIFMIIVMFSLIKSLSRDNNTAAVNITDSVCTLLVFLSLLDPVQSVINVAIDNLLSVKNFMTSFLPVYAGISMASGEFFTSAIYGGFFLTALVFVSDFLLNIILPSLQMYFAIIISDTLSPFIHLKSLSEFYVKAVRWTMKTIVSVICFILTVQTTISQGKDTLAVKAASFVSGAAIPVIGSALQDAMTSIYSSMEAIKGFAGAVGIIGIGSIFLPSIVSLTVYWLFTNLLYIISDVFESKSISVCLKGFITVTELVLSNVILYGIMLLFSLTIMISITNGV